MPPANTRQSLRLEKVVRDAVFRGEHEKIAKIVEQLCHDYAYAVHQPHARNGGLIGLAAASIALGSVRHWTREMRWRCWADMLAQSTGRSCTVPERDRSTGSSLLYRSRCAGPLLCLREHVQYCQGGQRRGPALLQ